ncbi:hypothetical protein [Pantoea stewartii]|nr:hypothetical protein [Pantoea stewartii]MBC0856481.1 hypothetical protein [Pantoea stewartii]
MTALQGAAAPGERTGDSRLQPLTLTSAIRLYTNPPAGSAELGGSAALAE